MQTSFTPEQLADPHVAESEKILRKCVHCGFCTATCPTYVTLGNELDSPRGRIYLIKDMLENSRPADREVVLLRDYAGMSWRDVTAELGRPTQRATEQLYQRARIKLGELLSRRVDLTGER